MFEAIRVTATVSLTVSRKLRPLYFSCYQNFATSTQYWNKIFVYNKDHSKTSLDLISELIEPWITRHDPQLISDQVLHQRLALQTGKNKETLAAFQIWQIFWILYSDCICLYSPGLLNYNIRKKYFSENNLIRLCSYFAFK